MDNCNLPHKKRRHDGSYNQKYHSRYKDNVREEGRDWRQETFGESRFAHHRGGHTKENDRDIQINLIGRKMKDPMFHVCEACSLPIRSYGRMLPCKHVFCFSCAKETGHNCPRCKNNVQRIEQCPLGTVWLCPLTATCKRTYLSQRDLQAHIDHRHKPLPVIPHPIVLPPVSVPPPNVPPPPITVPPPTMIHNPLSDPFMLVPTSTPPVISSSEAQPRPSSNLITVPIQDESQPPPPPPCRPHNQPQLYAPQSQPSSIQYQ